jgi:surface protein
MMFDGCAINNEYKPKCLQLNESFDFDNVNKDKKAVNIFDVYKRKLNYIIKKIISNDVLIADEKEFMLSLPASSYATNDDEIYDIISNYIFAFGEKCDLNWIDTSKVTDMSKLFADLSFNGNISKWDVSNVENMYCMFENSKFNGNISKWNTGKVKNMTKMFKDSLFNKDISKWDVSNVTDMK